MALRIIHFTVSLFDHHRRFCNVSKLYFSWEIRELEGKLRAGHMNKERHAQLAEKAAKEIQLKVCLFISVIVVLLLYQSLPITPKALILSVLKNFSIC